MKWIKQTDPNSLPGWICPECGSLVVQADKDAPPPCECRACGAGGGNPSDLATLGHLSLHKGGTPPMAAKERLKMPASAEEPDVFTDITSRESIIEGIRRAQVEAERRCIEANAVLINDAMFFSKLSIPPYGEMQMICGLRAFYCPTLPPDVSFAVCEVSMSSERDAEIIKALECCSVVPAGGCDKAKCPMIVECLIDRKALEKQALSLINRQKAEVSELQHRNSELEIELKAMRGAANSYKVEVERLQKYDEERDIRLHAKLVQKARAEATSEFVEKVKSAFDRYGMAHDCYAIVDEVAKEIGSGAG